MSLSYLLETALFLLFISLFSSLIVFFSAKALAGETATPKRALAGGSLLSIESFIFLNPGLVVLNWCFGIIGMGVSVSASVVIATLVFTKLFSTSTVNGLFISLLTYLLMMFGMLFLADIIGTQEFVPALFRSGL
ncbi:hypothetical protein ApAK_02655 [Thermoplasmatales archaeon AK]|nr:hypothetical protein [Thermoplasmatales archaeon AK]